MSWQLHKLKRLIAACGVALMLLDSGQQVHALCQLTGCQPRCEAQANDDCCQHTGQKSCQRRARPTNHGPALLAVHSCCQHSSHAPRCPAPENCVCCQSSPVALQSAVTVTPSDVDLCYAVHQLDDLTASFSASDSCWVASRNCKRDTHALATCVRLCRFLV